MKKWPIVVVLVPVLGLGGWLGYQHLVNWGWRRAPDEVKSLVEPHIAALQEATQEAASRCGASRNAHMRITIGGNPLSGHAVLRSAHFAAASAECFSDESVLGDRPSLPPIDGAGSQFTVNIQNTEGFKCMAPNFFGLDDRNRSDCVMWRGSGANLAVRYEITRRSPMGGQAKVSIEWRAGS